MPKKVNGCGTLQEYDSKTGEYGLDSFEGNSEAKEHSAYYKKLEDSKNKQKVLDAIEKYHTKIKGMKPYTIITNNNDRIELVVPPINFDNKIYEGFLKMGLFLQKK